MKKTFVLAAMAALWLATPALAEPPVPAPIEDHAKMLRSDDPQLAANKKLVYDMYRILLQAGHWERAGEFIADGYVQHNPNVENGLKAVQDYVRESRPEIAIEPVLHLPLVWIMAEGDRVTTTFVRPRKDENGQTYYTSWFDLYRIKDGKIVEHWDPALKTPEMERFNPNSTRMPQK
jgi:predicted SnoaL-like aldol condensation-catalyzing enzyme